MVKKQQKMSMNIFKVVKNGHQEALKSDDEILQVTIVNYYLDKWRICHLEEGCHMKWMLYLLKS